LLADPARGRALGRAGQARAAERFSLQATVRATEQLYDRLLARRTAPVVPVLRDEECP
jgi:hypothetical protein